MVEIVFDVNLYAYLQHYYSLQNKKILLFQSDLSFGKINPFTYQQIIRNLINYDHDRDTISYFRNEINIFFTQIKKVDQVRFWITDYYSNKISMYIICNQFKNIKKVYICNCDRYIDDFSEINHKMKEYENNCIEGNLEKLSEKGKQLLLENSELRIRGIYDIVSVEETYYDPLLQYCLDKGCEDCYDIEDEFLKYCGKDYFQFMNYYFFRKRVSILKKKSIVL